MDSGKSNWKRISPVFCKYSMTRLLCVYINHSALEWTTPINVRSITEQVLRKRIRTLLSICKWKRLCALNLVSKWWAAERGREKGEEMSCVLSTAALRRGKLSAVGLDTSSPLSLGGALHQQQVKVGACMEEGPEGRTTGSYKQNVGNWALLTQKITWTFKFSIFKPNQQLQSTAWLAVVFFMKNTQHGI